MLEELTLRKVVEFAVTTEETGARFYNRMASKFAQDEELASLFKQLAREEEVHQRQFCALLDEAPQSYEDKIEYERAQYLRAMAISEFFSKAGPLAAADQVATEADALKHALDLEKAALAYYLAVRDELGESSALSKIIAAEKQHMVRIMKTIVTGARFRSLQDEWP
jgi:rubrerythrin